MHDAELGTQLPGAAGVGLAEHALPEPTTHREQRVVFGEVLVVSGGVLDALLLFNPTDAYRLLNLSGSDEIAAASGMAGTVQNAVLAPAVLVAVLAAWVVAPMALAAAAFSRREL